ncbi:MAG: cardiolipin synthase [Planctomycetes bacterium]|nr:cardiolipin synthase [Planctomycetota bacterium]MCH9726234.1 cardiolipin synthase [Planctomycetota bacterium]MCH9775739.1 cardiolipin synthase [Planctomycetota bacterium]MCH9791777.1 cardiolipin synthase [Planctomycetota bacterium]
MLHYFQYLDLSNILLIAHPLLVIAVSVRVIMKRPATGVALAWLVLILAVPLAGVLFYFLIGERRIGSSRIRAIEKLRTDYKKLSEIATQMGVTDVDWSRHSSAVHGMNQLGQTLMGSSTVCGCSLELFSDTQEILKQITRDVDSAKTSVLMEFYIWNEGGLADEVLQALIRAASRGVSCRLLIDALGARPWWKSQQPSQLREAGIELQPALPVGLFRTFVGRTDLRVHRKIIVVDSEVAWTGSMNLVDPRYFKQGAGVGEWVDAMVRLKGTVVISLAATMIGDWILETGEPIEKIVKNTGLHLTASDGAADIQVIPSGPGESGDGLLQMLLALINTAQHELVLTTPYLVPDESLLRALLGAAGRGVSVLLIVPEKVDSFLTRYASRSYFDDLLNAGVEIYLYRGGLLHTKSVMADGAASMFGTVNLDMRSLWLNYEVSLFVYEAEFAKELRSLQQTYIDDADRLDAAEWKVRSFKERFLENTLRLVSPLL